MTHRFNRKHLTWIFIPLRRCDGHRELKRNIEKSLKLVWFFWFQTIFYLNFWTITIRDSCLVFVLTVSKYLGKLNNFTVGIKIKLNLVWLWIKPPCLDLVFAVSDVVLECVFRLSLHLNWSLFSYRCLPVFRGAEAPEHHQGAAPHRRGVRQEAEPPRPGNVGPQQAPLCCSWRWTFWSPALRISISYMCQRS